VSVLRRRNRRGRLLLSAAAGGSQGRALSLLDANVVFLGRSDVWDDYSQLSVDQSSRGVDLTDATTYAQNVAHGLDFTGSYTTEFLVQMRSGISTVFAFAVKGTVANGTTRLATFADAAGNIELTPEGADVAIPNLGASFRTYLLANTVEPNPDTTGPSDAMLSTNRLWDIVSGDYVEQTGVRVVGGVTPHTIVGASNGAGGNLFNASGHGRIRHVRISNVARSRAELEALIPLITADETLLTDGLVFDPSLETLLDPVSGLQGTATGTTYDSDLDARVFDGVDDSLAWASVHDITEGPYALSMWVRSTSLAAANGLFRIEPGDAAFALINTDGSVTFRRNRTSGTGTSVQTTAGVVAEDVWTHLAFVHDGDAPAAGMQIYVNGEDESAAPIDGTGTVRAADGNWVFGRISAAFLTGAIAREVKGWSRVLSPQEWANYFATLTAPDA
jgi:hypothetical protein